MLAIYKISIYLGSDTEDIQGFQMEYLVILHEGGGINTKFNKHESAQFIQNVHVLKTFQHMMRIDVKFFVTVQILVTFHYNIEGYCSKSHL